MVAGEVGQQVAQAITQNLAERQCASEDRARELQARYDAERAAARAETAVVHRPDWWDRATREQVGHMWQTATAWRGEDVDVDRAAQVMTVQVRDRYGVDVTALAEQQRTSRLAEVRVAAQRGSDYEQAREWARENDPALYRDHECTLMGSDSARDDQRQHDQLVETWRERTEPEVDRLRAEARSDERTAAAVLAEPVDGVEQLHSTEREAATFSEDADRRAALADRLDHANVGAEAKEARLVAHDAKGVPAAAAVTAKKSTPKARTGRNAARQRDQTLSR